MIASLARLIGRTSANYLYSILYTRPDQLLWRVAERIRRGVVRARRPSSRPPRIRQPSAALIERYGPLAAARLTRPPGAWDAARPESLTFLSQGIPLGFPPRWDYISVDGKCADSHLWFFHLHYFDWIFDLLGARREDLALMAMRSWIDRNRLGGPAGFLGPWHSYTISRRLPNWIAAYATLERSGVLDRDSRRELLGSIAKQARFLSTHIEWEHRGNHLLENLIALNIADAFVGTGAKRRTRHERLLAKQLEEQISPGGFHHEFSPMYHAELLERLCDLLILRRGDGSDLTRQLEDTVGRMAALLVFVLHPDGGLPLLGDSVLAPRDPGARILEREDVRIAPKPDSRGGTLRFGTRDGHVVFRDLEHGDFLIFDGAALGPDHLGAHMHADLMGYELTLSGRRFISDGGGGIYVAGPSRRRLRAAREHAVLRVDSVECASPWKSFRMGRRGHPLELDASPLGPESFRIRGLHDGHAPAGVLHERVIEIDASSRVYTITDTLVPIRGKEPARPRRVECFLPLHRGMIVSREGPASFMIGASDHPHLARLQVECGLPSLEVDVINGWQYEQFGVARERPVIRATTMLRPGIPLVVRIQPL